MRVSIVSCTDTLEDTEVQRAVRAVNRQFERDFEPQWHFGAQLQFAGHGAPPAAGKSLLVGDAPGQGDAVIYLLDKPTVDGAEGMHDLDGGDVPYGFVFLDVCKEVDDPWTVTLSHEAIELVGDPLANLLVEGPHPEKPHHMVFHQFELCDAVQDEKYEIDGVPVSNFVLPPYFARRHPLDARTDFVGRPKDAAPLRSFDLTVGGYLCFWDAERQGNKWRPYWRPEDKRAEQRFAAKSDATQSRMARRVRTLASGKDE